MSKFNWKKYGIYHFKWQMGIIITWPLMYFFVDYLHWPYLPSMIAFQFVGAIVFYPIDAYILSKKDQAGQTKN